MREKVLGRSHFSISGGLGFTSFQYNNNLNIVTDPATQKQSYSFLPTDTAYNKNRQVLQYIEAPFELRYRSTSDKKGRYFRFYPLIKVGYLVKSYSHFENGDYSVVHFKIQDLNRWRVLAGVRTGYWIFSLYATYELTPLYQNVTVGETDLSKFKTLNVGLSISL